MLENPLVLRLRRIVFARYLIASVIALAFDFALYLALVAGGMSPSLAAAVGYCAGIGIHWMISAEFVFRGKRREGGALQVQRTLFAATALVGLGLTVGTVTIADAIGFTPVVGKGIATAISFVTVYALRKYGVFR